MHTVGLPLIIRGQQALIRVRLRALMSDGDGLRVALDWKGAKALKPCWRHPNCVRKDGDLTDGVSYHDITNSDHTTFIVWEEGELQATIDIILSFYKEWQEGRVTKAQLEKVETAAGFNANPHGLIADATLRPYFDLAKVCRYDWMHCALQNGTMTVEMWKLMKTVKAIGHTAETFEDYLKDPRWRFPHHTSSKMKGLHTIFCSWRRTSCEKADRFKAAASEIVCLYSVCRHYVASVIGNRADIKPQLDSFYAACAVVDLFLGGKRYFDTRECSEALLRAIRTHMSLHEAAYGLKSILPKHHWLIDCAQQMAELGVVLDQFVIERIHLLVKSIVENICNTTYYEASAMSGVCCAMWRNAAIPMSTAVLSIQVVEEQGCRFGKHINSGGKQVHASDVVIRGNVAGRIVICCHVDDKFLVIVDTMTCLTKVSHYAERWQLDGGRETWPVDEVAPAAGRGTT